jgi:glutamate-ammonia-ligase adenylyltransferase
MNDVTADALDRAWHRDSARASLDRWRQVCAQEGWSGVPAREDLLVAVFGASWYFTRFIFFRGPDAVRLLDEPMPQQPWREYAAARLGPAAAGDDVEDALDRLRIARNELMLLALAGWLDGRLDQAALEQALTAVAESVLEVLMERFLPDSGVAVLGLGRFAGSEMTFGSDLDLIFLYEGDGTDPGGLYRGVRLLLRHMATASPHGTLYEVDMRLRPHGTGGALITDAGAFREYHAADRPVWERQMMTRCRAVCDPRGTGGAAMRDVLPHIYGRHDPGHLRSEIFAMRMRVERELGRVEGKLELKRGMGGIMDVDFASHYLQLAHGADVPSLRTCSTRVALRAARDAGLVAGDVVGDLLEGYEFLKRIETCVRCFDVRATSVLAREEAALAPVARAMGFGDDVAAFEAAYRRITASVRARFSELLGG